MLHRQPQTQNLPHETRETFPHLLYLFLMAALSAHAAEDSMEKLAQDPARSGLDWIDKNAAWVTYQQVQLTEIPAPDS